MEAHLQVEEGPSVGSILVLQPGETKTIGRGPGVDLRLDDPTLAPRHAAARLAPDGLQVIDLGGPGGIRIDGRPSPPPVRSPVPVDSGDLVRLGAHALRAVLVGAGPRPARRAAEPFPADEFQDVRRIGAGATGKVYRARWVPSGRDVALKLLREELGSGTPEHARFLRECGVVARLRSPFIVQVLDVREGGGQTFAILELITGPPLEAVLARGPLDVPSALRVAEDVAAALDVASRHGVVHRDVKPANVLLDPVALACRLCDFGLAKDLTSTLRTLTAQGVGLGTLAYLPPEQVSSARAVGPAADVYALGATLFHALAGRPPFLIGSEGELGAVLTHPPPALESLRPDAPPEVAAMVRAALAKAPAERPTAAALGAALRRSREGRFPGWDPRALFARR